MFAYCNNNSVLLIDSEGTRPVVGADPQKESADERSASCAVMKEEGKRRARERRPAANCGAATPYNPVEAIGVNCYAYVLGENQSRYVGGGVTTVEDYSVDLVAEMVLSDMQKEGRGIRIIDAYDSPIADNEYRIALRTRKDDYHFMMQHSDGTWSHKPGVCSSRLAAGYNPSIITWDSPKINGWKLASYGMVIEEGVNKSYYYGKTVYFAVCK